MADYVGSERYYDFAKMVVELKLIGVRTLKVVDGKIGWVNCLGGWVMCEDEVQEAYSKWLDKQIYGESNG